MGWPGSSEVPQRKPGEKAISASFTFHQRIEDDLVEGAVEVAAAVQQPFRDGQLFVEFRQVGRARLVDQRLHVLVGRQQVGEDRQQLVAEVGDLAVLDVEIEHAEVLAVGAGVGDQRLAAGVLDDDRRRHAVVGVAAEDGVDAAHARPS
jgi:hypothetical protein